ncbi:MAG: isochorismatase family protein [Thermoactinomyces sp.]
MTAQSQEFFRYMEEIASQVSEMSFDEFLEEMEGPEHVYVVYVDILMGFCECGPLSSPLVNEVVKPIADWTEYLFKKGFSAGNLVFLNDYHPKDAVEFEAFAPHCVRDTEESRIVPSLRKYLDLAEEQEQVFLKNATNGLFGKNCIGVRFCDWLERAFQKGKTAFIVIGDCTDLCIYQNAMAIRLLANELNAKTRVIVPQAHTRTYDLPVQSAKSSGVMAHDAKVLETVFYYHMILNGIEVISGWKEG